MKIKNIALVALISLCTIPAYGMENNTNNNNFENSLMGLLQKFAQQHIRETLSLYKKPTTTEKAARKEIFKSKYNENSQFMYNESKVNSLTAQEKNDLLASLQQNNQLIAECYSAEETWSSVETFEQHHNSKQLIKQLEQH